VSRTSAQGTEPRNRAPTIFVRGRMMGMIGRKLQVVWWASLVVGCIGVLLCVTNTAPALGESTVFIGGAVFFLTCLSAIGIAFKIRPRTMLIGITIAVSLLALIAYAYRG
jgi:hypothetical protein